MNETGQDARDAFLTGSDDVPSRTGPLHGVPEQDAAARRGRGRRRIRVLVAAGTLATVATAGVTAALLAQFASGAPSALAAVTSAITATSAESYSFTLDSTVRFAGREINSDVVTGTFDPRHETGAELLTTRGLRPARTRIRFVGKYVYTWIPPGSGFTPFGKPWDKSPAEPPAANVLPVDDLYGFSSARPVSPAELLVVLRSAATARDEGPASGPGWSGTRYAFTARLGARYSVSGTVYVDQQGRVRRLMTTTRQGMATTGQGRKLTTARDFTFGDFGAPVPVTAPSAGQVKYTRSPYWGFYF